MYKRQVIDRLVENALLKRALGYEFDEVKEKYEDGVLTERIITRKEVVPDTTAQIFWLKNRKPKDWRDKINYEEINAAEAETDGFLDALKGEAAESWQE